MEIGFEAFRGLTIGRLELLNCASLQNIDDSAFLSARIQALAISDSRLEKITKVGRTCIPVIYICTSYCSGWFGLEQCFPTFLDLLPKIEPRSTLGRHRSPNHAQTTFFTEMPIYRVTPKWHIFNRIRLTVTS